MENFQTVLTGIDPGPLLNQLSRHPRAWSKETLWTREKRGTAIYNEDNIVLRYVTLGQAPGLPLILFEGERNRDTWTQPSADIFTEAWPIVFDLMRAVRGEHIGHVIITRLPPGGTIGRHIDEYAPGVSPYWQRHQVPLASHPDVAFRCGNEELYLEPGAAYWFNNQLPHSVHNRSRVNRLSMVVEIRPLNLSRQ